MVEVALIGSLPQVLWKVVLDVNNLCHVLDTMTDPGTSNRSEVVHRPTDNLVLGSRALHHPKLVSILLRRVHGSLLNVRLSVYLLFLQHLNSLVSDQSGGLLVWRVQLLAVTTSLGSSLHLILDLLSLVFV